MVFVDILLPIFLVVAAGTLFSRALKPSLEPLTLFSLYVATPALVFGALVSRPLPPATVLRLLAHMGLYTAVLWGLAEAAGRLLRLDEPLRRAFALAVVPMNVGNYGLPLTRFAFGREAEPFSVLVFVVFNLPLATWAIWLAAGGTVRSLAGMRDALRIPILHATVLAFALSALALRPAEPLLKGVSLLGEASIPLLLVILGMQLQRTRAAGSALPIAAATVLRLAVSPPLAWGLGRLLGFGGLDLKVLVLQTSTPAAVLPLLYTLRFGGRSDWIASNLLVSTLASALTLSVVLAFLL